MASRYRYGWDSVNKKKVYMGKYPEANPEGQGYYGRNDAGQKMEFTPNTAGVDREFVGSPSQEYTFSNARLGTLTFTAESWEEALRIARSRGFTRGDYKKR